MTPRPPKPLWREVQDAFEMQRKELEKRILRAEKKLEKMGGLITSAPTGACNCAGCKTLRKLLKMV